MGSCGGKGCTLQGCAYTLRINFVRQSSWQAETWDIVLEESGTGVGSCTIELQEPESSSGTSCSGQLDVDETADGKGVASVETFYDFTEGETSVDDPFSRTITLSVRRNGKLVTESTFEPNFERRYVNGTHCGVTCWQATVQYAF